MRLGWVDRKKSWVNTLLLGSVFLFYTSPFAIASSLQCQHLPQLFEAYLRSHYSQKKLTDDIKKHTVEQFIKMTDPSKTMLLNKDVQKLRKDLLGLFATMPKGNCSVLDDVSKLMLAKAKEQEAFAKSKLGADYKLDETVELQTDPQKRGNMETVEQLNQLQMKLLHFQISNYLLTDIKLDDARKQLIHRYELITKRYTEKTLSKMMEDFAEAFALALDPHSSYMSQEVLEDFNIHMRLSLEGIGASLSSQDGFTVIEELIPGGGAEKSRQLRPKDKIIAVAQEKAKPVSTTDMDLKDVVRMIRGKKGTKVTLTILRQGEKNETFDVTIVRDKIDIKESAAKITYETKKVGSKNYRIGVIDLPSFYGGMEKGAGRSSYEDVKKLVIEAKKKNVDGMVLNLSRNGGGLLEDAVRISGLFIKKGAVVAMKDADQQVKVLADEDEDVQYNGPLVVLISRISASASEILAGALKDYGRAVVVGGDHTFGKGTVQVLSGLPLNLGAMKVTTGMFFLPGGFSTQHRGVSSDIMLPSVFNTDDVGEATLDYSLPPQSIPAFLSKEAQADDPLKKWKPLDSSLLARLSEKSRVRVTKDDKFLEIKKELAESQKNKGILKLSEMRKKAEAETKKEAKAKKDKKQKLNEMDSPYVKESLNIVLDLIEA